MKRHLIIVDVQNDFCIGGSLPTERGRDIIHTINELSTGGFFDTVTATQDWHPKDHCSFEQWPEHCRQGTFGAAFHPYLNVKPINFIIRKGMRKDVDSYSAFKENDGTETRLERLYIPFADNEDENEQKFYICGIATDFCVKATAIDCANLFGANNVLVMEDACAPVTKEGGEAALNEMAEMGIWVVTSDFGFNYGINDKNER